MSRRLDNWLRGYQLYTAGTEPPETFHWWTALGTIAGAAQRKIYLDAGYFQIYPNLYVILVAPPGKARKTTALRIGKGILKHCGDFGQELHFSTQSSSAAALIKQLTAIKNKDHQSLTGFISELGSLLGSGSTEITDFLTDIYDCNPDWDKQTIGRGLEKIERPWFNMIGATTPQWMGENLSKTAVEGGFVSRTIFVYADRAGPPVAFPSLTEEQRSLRRSLAHDLAHIAGLKGTFTFSDEAREFYTYWYEQILPNESNMDYRLTGYFERKHVHVLKTAMLLRLAIGTTLTDKDLVLQKVDIEAAVGMLSELEPGMRKAFSAVGKNVYSTDLERMLSQIRASKKMRYKEILATNIHAIDKETIDKVLDSLLQMGEIQLEGQFYVAAGG